MHEVLSLCSSEDFLLLVVLGFVPHLKLAVLRRNALRIIPCGVSYIPVLPGPQGYGAMRCAYCALRVSWLLF